MKNTLLVEVFTCDNCKRQETISWKVAKYWVTIYDIKEMHFCGDECMDSYINDNKEG